MRKGLICFIITLTTGIVSCQSFAQQSCPLFAGLQVNWPTSYRSVESTDVDGDGDNDLVGCGNTVSVSVWNNLGNGTFAPAVAYPADGTTTMIVLADVDRDGDRDVITVSEFAGRISILLSDGRGNFGAFTSYPVGSTPVFVAVGDLDGDTDADLAVCNSQSPGAISVLFNNGMGMFGAASVNPVGFLPRAVAIGRFDADDFADLAVIDRTTGETRRVVTLHNLGSGMFGSPTVLFQDSVTLNGLLVGDYDDDSDDDLVAFCSSNPEIMLFRNDGQSMFATTLASVGFSGASFGVLRDINGDRLPDLSFAIRVNGENKVSVLHNAGNGSFGSFQAYGTCSDPLGITANDLNGDEDVDLALASSGGAGIATLRNQGDGSFQTYQVFAENVSSWNRIASEDLDGDRDIDLVVTGFFGSVAELKNNGDGSYAVPTWFPVGGVPRSIIAEDLDADGDSDIVVTTESNAVVVLKNVGNGTFGAPIGPAGADIGSGRGFGPGSRSRFGSHDSGLGRRPEHHVRRTTEQRQRGVLPVHNRYGR